MAKRAKMKEREEGKEAKGRERESDCIKKVA